MRCCVSLAARHAHLRIAPPHPRYDCTWRKADIIVMDSVAITPPYTGASVAAIVGGSDAAGLATRIAKVVQGYRAKGGLGADIDAALAAAGPGQPA